MVWDMKSSLGAVEFKESVFLSARSCRGEREKGEKRNFFCFCLLCLMFRHLTFTYRGFFFSYSLGLSQSNFLYIFWCFFVFRRFLNYLSHLVLLKAVHWIGAQNNHIEIRIFCLLDSSRIHLVLKVLFCFSV